MSPFTLSNDVRNDGNELRARMRRDGYLFFRGLITPEATLEVRREILRLCAGAGWLAAGTEIMDGIAAPGVAHVEPQPEYMAVYNQVMKNEAFHTLAHAPGLLAMLRTLFGEEPLTHPRNIARIIFPQNLLFTTPAHQDFIHIQGTEETYTAWIPLGDCPLALGSLIVLAGSHGAQEIYPVHEAYGAGGLGIATEAMPYAWVGGDFANGDLVVFHSLTVHKALPNLSPDRLRLSVDFRYQPLSHPVAQSSLLPHFAQLTWEEIYTGWNSARYQYYWRDLPLVPASQDPRVHALRRAAHEKPE
jgi:ectoine hydroxylase-related dioxygenase (phytanoyl-CoA dioxygenase family)